MLTILAAKRQHDLVDLRTYKPVYTYTTEPFRIAAPHDGTTDIDVYRHRLARYNHIERNRRNPMLNKRDAEGRPLYRLTEAGNIVRKRSLSKERKQRVRERDKNQCVWCGATERLEVDHIIRYADGGSNELNNLRLLCHTCHGSRGGRA